MQDFLAAPSRIGWAFFFFTSISILCLALMLWDKHCARKGRRRIPEKTLLVLFVLGGAAGGKIGQRVFRHKTRKQPFAFWLNMSMLWNATVFTLLGSSYLRGILLQNASHIFDALLAW